MKAVSATFLPASRAPAAPRFTHRPLSVKCDRSDVWHRNCALQQEQQSRVTFLRQAIDGRSVAPPTPTMASLYGQLRAAEAARCIAAQKVTLLQAEAAAHGLPDMPMTVRETAIGAVGQLPRSAPACDNALEPQRLWGRWALIRASAPGAFKPVSLPTSCGLGDNDRPFDVQSVVRTLIPDGSYSDTLILGTVPHDPVGVVHITGYVEARAKACLRLVPRWLSCGALESPNTDVCPWQAYDMPLRFIDDDMLVIGDAYAAGPGLQAWVRCSS